MEYHVLGPLEVVRDGRTLELGAGKQRSLLVALLLNANEVVSTDRLIDALWGEQAPATAPKIVQGYVSRLRKVLDGDHGHPGRAPREGVLLTRSPGYVLRVDDGQLDSARFATLLARGRATLARGSAHEAATILQEALGLWRGPPLADFAFDAFAQEEVARLEELRLVALEERIEVDLVLGGQADLVGELETLIARQPLRERFRAQLMLALYRCDRQSEALQVYQEARELLVAELGLEPSRRLRDLEQAILRQDPSLDGSGLPARPSEPPSTDTVEPAFEHQPASVFVGRDGELALLSSALDDAVAGRGRLVVVGGEPGIGKSRLAEELASQAAEREGTVLWGRCWEAGGAPPYWPWVQAIRSYVRVADPQQLLAELGAGAADIADVVAEVRQRIPDIGPSQAIDDPQIAQIARFHLFDSITAFLTSASRAKPLVLIIDDLHWADEGSLRLLEFAARELSDSRLLVVGTYRDIELSRRHPFSQTLAELSRERSFERIVLRGLDRDDVSRFVEAACGTAPPSELVDAVHAHTEGNPFFVTEIVRLLGQEGDLTSKRLSVPGAWGIRIPEGVREVIGRRLDHLSDACNRTLAVASIIGREFSLEQLNGLVEDTSEDLLLDLLEEALAARVIEELPAAPGRYQFTHALIQETLAAELSLTRRVRLHGRIAEVLEALYGEHVDLHASELAHHFGEAQTLLGPAKFVRYSLTAGEAALAAHAHEQALAYFERALAAKGDVEEDDETAALCFGLGRAQLGALPRYELEPASTSLRRAFNYYAHAGDVSRAVAVAAHPVPLSLGLGYTSFPDLIARALDLVEPDSYEAGRLIAQHGWYCGIVEGDHGGAHGAFRRALSIAEQQNDEALERRTLANAAWVDVWHFRPQDCLREGLRAIELAGRLASDEEPEIDARRSVIWALMGSGELEAVRTHTESGFALAQKVRDRWSLASAGFDVARLAIYEGDWATARLMSEVGSRAQPRDPRALAMRALVEYETGDFDAGAGYIARLDEVGANVPAPGPIAEHAFVAGAIPITARIADSDERLDSAAASATTLLSLPRIVPAFALVARAALALIAVQRNDAEAATREYHAIEPHKGTACFIIPLTFDRLLGLLAVTAGETDRALMHYEDGLAFCERAGYRPEYAWTACDYADAMLLQAHRGDRVRATALQVEAHEIASELQMRPLIDRLARSSG